jgi:hypothetical protein
VNRIIAVVISRLSCQGSAHFVERRQYLLDTGGCQRWSPGDWLEWVRTTVGTPVSVPIAVECRA